MAFNRTVAVAAAVALGTGVLQGSRPLAGVEVAQVAAVPATQPDARQVIRVKSAEAFVKALGPERIIELEEGEYKLLDVPRGAGQYFKWEKTFDGYELLIRNCNRLTIRGAGEKAAHVTMSAAYSNVLCFQKCNDLELVNLKLGHAPDPGFCAGGVIKADECERVMMRACDLYGCGIEGLTLRNVKQLDFVNSVIHDCSYGVMDVDDCEGLRFSNSSFRRIEELYGFQLGSATGVSFVDCVVEDVAVKGPLFDTNLSDPASAITFKGGAIRNNKAKSLVNTAGMLKLEGVKQDGNIWPTQ